MTSPPAKSSTPSQPQRKLRLKPHPLNSIPSHPSLTSQSTVANPPLRPFILSLLSEAVTFADDFLPSQFTSKGTKSSSPATAKVQLLGYEDKSAGESWFGRRSEHVDEEREGTGCWREFRQGLLDNHSIHEKEYTPDVFDAHKVLDWATEIQQIMSEQGWDGYEDVNMEIYEMAHTIPPPLQNRVFPVLVLRALTPHTTAPNPSFIVIQIPLDLGDVPAALYSSGRHRRESLGNSKASAKATVGSYVSVERVKLVGGESGESKRGAVSGAVVEGGNGGGEGGKGRIVWEMATASDAKGNLPMALQKLGVPGAVVKDVGLFIGWVGENRRKKGRS